MEFRFGCEKLLKPDSEGFAILDGRNMLPVQQYPSNRVFNRQIPESQNNLQVIIDKMGELSAKAQSLPSVITSASKFFTSDNRLYFKVDKNIVIGLLKVGKKNLFIRNEAGQIKEISPLCVLDFYVHESVQRGGHGKALFEKMLQFEKQKPEKLGYDRPSEKLLAFLAKHYGLKRYVPQNNNYVVFSQYFEQVQKPVEMQNNNTGLQFFSNRQVPIQQASQTVYNQKQQKNQGSDIFGTQQNFNSKLPPKQAKNFQDRQLSNAGLQVFGNNASQIKRSTTSDRLFGENQENQKENQNKYRPKDQMSQLLSGMDNLNIKDANQFKMQKIDHKIQETEQLIKQNQDKQDQMSIYSRESKYKPQSQMANILNIEGPTSFGSHQSYNKRNQYSTYNEESSKRYSENQQFVQFQKQFNRGGRVPWGSYNYENQKK